MAMRTEAELHSAVTAECDRLGVAWHACGQRIRCQGPPGQPDLLIAGPGGLILRELKSADGVLTVSQRWWRDVLRAAGCDYGIWQPRDWHSGRIRQELAAVAGVHYQPDDDDLDYQMHNALIADAADWHAIHPAT